MSEVIKACVQHLNSNRREFIVMRVSEAYKDENQEITAFRNSLDQLMNPFRNNFWCPTDINNKQLPTVGEARGKIVIMHDYQGIQNSDLPFRVENVLEDSRVNTILPASIDWKWEQIERSFKLAVSAQRDPNKMFITYTGGWSSGAYPSGVADRINPKLDAFLGLRRIDGKRIWGIVAMDFPGLSLIQGIMDSNFEA